jgi:hypothetical protein
MTPAPPDDRAPETRYGGYTADELHNKHRWAPSEANVTVDDERAETGIDFYEAAYAAMPDLLETIRDLTTDYAGLEALDAEAEEGAAQLYAERDALKAENAKLKASLDTHSCILEAIVNMHPELEDYIEARIWGEARAGEEGGD